MGCRNNIYGGMADNNNEVVKMKEHDNGITSVDISVRLKQFYRSVYNGISNHK